jgi:NAD(P)-dependent dehydrogenase (short-subunit alcohol dehydrogenase family)
MASIAGHHVVVLGGMSGFGFATAKAAIAEGARVTIAARSAEKVHSALGRLSNAASGECVDVTDKLSPKISRGMGLTPPSFWIETRFPFYRPRGVRRD